VEKEADTGTEEVELIKKLYQRFAINIHSRFRGIGLSDMTNEEVYSEVVSL